jgi:hypothetical protein
MFAEALVNVGKTGLGRLRGGASMLTFGISVFAGFYSGAIEYAADSPFNWWN